jgi:uncharacterized protein (DUF58 family)
MKTRLTFWILIICVVVLVVVQIYLRDSVFVTALYAVGGVLVFSWIFTRASIRNLSVSRKSRENRQQVGQIFKENFEISNHSWLPKTWSYLEDGSGIYQNSTLRFFGWIAGKKSQSFISQSTLTRRGQFVLGPTKIHSGDPFGVFRTEREILSKEKLLVIPYYEKLEFFPFPSGLLSGGKAQRTRHLEVSPYAVSVRDYSPGDPLRRIDWKSTAKKNHLMVKEFEDDPQSSLWIIIDGNKRFLSKWLIDKSEDPSNIFINQNQRKTKPIPQDNFEHQVSIAASIGEHFYREGKTIGFWANSNNGAGLTPESGERQLDKLLELLALINADSKESIITFIESRVQQIPKGSTVVVITASNEIDLCNPLELLKIRGSIPILLGINSKSYGSDVDNSDLIAAASLRGIQNLNLNREDLLSEKMSALEK